MMKKRFTLFKMVFLLCAMVLGGVSPAWADDVTLWSEDFSSYSANDVPSGGTYNYSCGGANTKIYAEALAGGKSPELLLQKSSNGTFTATIPLDNIEGDLTLTFKTNNQKIKVETTTTGLTGGLEEKAEGTHTATFKGVTTSTTSITIKFTCSGSSNVRLDDIVLTGTKSSGGGDTPTTWTVTYDGNGATSGTVPVDENVYDADHSIVTVLGNTGDLAKEHYTFTNWNTQANGEGTGYVAGNTFTISGNTKLYAQWAINSYNVTLPAEDEYGTYTMDAENPVKFGTQVTLTYTPATGYENYVATWSVNGVALEDNQFTMPDEAVTVTVSVAEKITADMTIDFESAATVYTDWTFTNIVSNYSTSGVSAHGGSKYGSTDGKATAFIQTKEKVNPVSLTCYVSKESTNTSASTWYIQVSSDGTTWEDVTSRSASNMSKGEWKEFTADLSDYSDKYVRVYYDGTTAKRCIDDLTLVVNSVPVPAITVDDADINVDASFQDITRDVTYKNITISDMTDFGIQYYDADGNEVSQPNWISATVAEQDPGIGEGYVLSCIVNANKGNERTAYLKVYAMDDETNLVYSNLVTITQAKFVRTCTYSHATTIKPGKHYIIVGITDDDDVYAMGGQNTNNRAAVEVTPNADGTISVTGNGSVREFLVDMDGNYYTFYDETEGGYLYAASSGSNYLKTKAENDENGKWEIDDLNSSNGEATVKAQGDYTRNEMRFNSTNMLFSCYGENSDFPRVYLYENNDELAIPIAAACTDGDKCFGTFSSTKAFVVPEGLTVSEIAIQGDGTMQLANYGTDDVVPANTGVIVSAAEGGYYTVNVSNDDEGTSILGTNNALRPTGDNGITATDMGSNDSNCKFYRLTMHNGTEIGFWWGAENGAAFDVAANKAYMVVSADLAGARQGFGFDDTTTGISDATRLNNKEQIIKNNWYDLQGRKVNTPTKGLYIVNGKKVVIK